MIRLKDVTVSLDNTHPKLWEAVVEIHNYFQRMALGDITLTSCRDGRHMSGSLHYTGRAFDLRMWAIPESDRQNTRDEFAVLLGDDYDVVLESTHYHIEYDPKPKKADTQK